GILLILESHVRHLKLLLGLLVANTVFMLIANVLFSPDEGKGLQLFLFRINWEGVRAGVVGALKRDAMLLVSFAWLSATHSPDQMCSSFSFTRNRSWNKFVLVFLKGIQIFTIELRNHYYSMLARGVVRG